MDKQIALLLEKMKREKDFGSVRFVYVFGSRAKGTAGKMSDYDVAVYYEGDGKERFRFRVRMNTDKRFDVHIFQDLPLSVQNEVLRGKVVYVREGDERLVYDVAYGVIRKFEMFKRYYYDYLERRQMVK